MRVALLVPDLRDPAHAAVASGLGPALEALGHAVLRCSVARGGVPAAWRPDVVHIHAFSRRWVGRRAWRAPAGSAVVLTVQGADPSLVTDPWVLAALARDADCLTTVSRDGRRALAKRWPRLARRAAVVANGARAGLPPRPRSGPDVLTVGRVAAYKGLDVLAMALSGLPGVSWTFVGPDQTGGRFARFLSRLGLSDRARAAGPLPPASVRALMASCRVFVQPSRAENMPMALLEAMAAGAPCVSSDAGGCREALGRAGVLVRPGDEAALGRALSRLLGEPARARRLGRAARRRAGRFGWDAAARSYVRLYARARRAKSHAVVLDSRP